VLLQQQGVINDILVWTGLVADNARIVMINNATGTIIAMTHILLPFMILPLYSVMKTIPKTYVRAALSRPRPALRVPPEARDRSAPRPAARSAAP
jgi:putative spermidine/putrescine transport system permease protein